jgi:tRNA threonylcarbamoyladenosine biosynthesis protein TsaB
MLILALDTSTQAGSLAVLNGGRLMGVVSTRTEETYSSRMFRHLEFLLRELGLEQRQFDLYAVAAGPGSFTGLRVGLAAVKGWAEVFGKPIAAVSALAAVAAQAKSHEEFLVPMIDARRGQVYAGLYERHTDSLSPLPSPLFPEEVVMTPAEVFSHLAGRAAGRKLAFVTPDPEVLEAAVRDSIFCEAHIERVPAVLAPSIGLLGMEKVVVRPMAPGDVHAVLTLQRSSPDAAQWSAAEYERICAPAEAASAGSRQSVLLAEANSQLTGFLAFRIAGGECEILNLVVAVSARRTGVGAHLLNEALAQARGLASRVFLEVRESNQTARAFYRRNGFREVGRRRGYYSGPVQDAVVMGREV